MSETIFILLFEKFQFSIRTFIITYFSCTRKLTNKLEKTTKKT